MNACDADDPPDSPASTCRRYAQVRALFTDTLSPHLASFVSRVILLFLSVLIVAVVHQRHCLKHARETGWVKTDRNNAHFITVTQ